MKVPPWRRGREKEAQRANLVFRSLIIKQLQKCDCFFVCMVYTRSGGFSALCVSRCVSNFVMLNTCPDREAIVKLIRDKKSAYNSLIMDLTARQQPFTISSLVLALKKQDKGHDCR